MSTGFAEMSLEDWERFFDLSLDMFCVAGTDGYYKRLNPAWERTLGWTLDELLARPWIEFVHPADRVPTDAQGAALADGRTVLQFENRYLAKDGSVRWLHWNALPIPERSLIYGAARDVTEMRNARDELERRVRERTLELERLNDELRESHTRALHTLTTPVVRVHEGVLLLTVVGAVDAHRASRIMETVLSRVVEERARVLILDIAGLPSMTEELAQYLVQTTTAIRMLGAETIVTGIGVSVAKTLIQLGVDVSRITTTAQLAGGLDLALAIVGKAVGRR